MNGARGNQVPAALQPPRRRSCSWADGELRVPVRHGRPEHRRFGRPEAGGAPAGTFRRFSEKYHTTTEQLGDLARQARPKLLILYHYNSQSPEELQMDMMRRYGGHFVVGRGLDVY
jgi:hypothetical protein